MQGEYVIMKKGFDANKYIEEQSKYILERIKKSNSQRLAGPKAREPAHVPARPPTS